MCVFRNTRITKILVLSLVFVQAYSGILHAQQNDGPRPSRMEIPVYDDASYKQYIIHKGFDLVFNENTRIPEWVAYELTAEEVAGTAPRAKHFAPDPDVNGTQGDNEDYRNTGWDRGHMVPAGDMKLDDQMMRESFYFSNVCPQNRNLNGGDWRSLEELCRIYAQQYDKVFIVCGPIVGNNIYGRLGNNQLVIPDAFFKVLLVETKKGYEAIGFLMNNEAGHKPLSTYAKTVDEIEEITGLDFFSLLPDKVENKVESSYILSVWQL